MARNHSTTSKTRVDHLTVSLRNESSHGRSALGHRQRVMSVEGKWQSGLDRSEAGLLGRLVINGRGNGTYDSSAACPAGDKLKVADHQPSKPATLTQGRRADIRVNGSPQAGS